MSLMVKAFSHSGWESLQTLLACLGCEALNAEAVECWKAKDNLPSEATFLVLHRRPEQILATAMRSGQTAEQAVSEWQEQAVHLLEWLKHNRRNSVVLEIDALVRGPEAVEKLCDWLSIECPEKLPILPSFAENNNLDLLLATQLLRQHEQGIALLGQLEAYTLPLTAPSFVVPHFDIAALSQELNSKVDAGLLENTQQENKHLTELNSKLEQTMSAHKDESAAQIKAARADLRAQQEERNLLLEQLHQVQMEFEGVVLEKQKVLEQKESELSDIQQQLDQACEELNLFKSSGLYKLLKPEQKAAKTSSAAKKRSLRRNIQKLKASDLFDKNWYLQTYPDVAANDMDPVRHYLKFGAQEGRNPSPKFNTLGYLDMYPDVADSGINPLIHFIEHGIAEGRSPLPDSIQN